MKFLIVVAVTVACAAAGEDFVPIVKSVNDISPEGGYQYAFETGNGIYVHEEGALTKTNSEYPSIEVQGGYKYTSPDGFPVEVTYTAGENGFQPQGSHLPVPPPIPELIARSLAYTAAHPVAVAKAAANVLG